MTKPDLKILWEVGSTLSKTYTTAERQRGSIYWKKIDIIVCAIVDKDKSKLAEYKISEINKTKEIGTEAISYWEEKVKDFNKLSKKEAIKMLIKAQKIEQKIQTIERVINRDYVI